MSESVIILMQVFLTLSTAYYLRVKTKSQKENTNNNSEMQASNIVFRDYEERGDRVSELESRMNRKDKEVIELTKKYLVLSNRFRKVKGERYLLSEKNKLLLQQIKLQTEKIKIKNAQIKLLRKRIIEYEQKQ